MYGSLFHEFVSSNDNLRVYQRDRLIYYSAEDRLTPLIKYINQFLTRQQPVVIFDRIVDNAAALLCVLAGSQEVHSPVGSQLATKPYPV